MHAEDPAKDAKKRARDCDQNTDEGKDDSSGQGKQESWREMVLVLVRDALTRLPQSVVFPVSLLIILVALLMVVVNYGGLVSHPVLLVLFVVLLAPVVVICVFLTRECLVHLWKKP